MDASILKQYIFQKGFITEAAKAKRDAEAQAATLQVQEHPHGIKDQFWILSKTAGAAADACPLMRASCLCTGLHLLLQQDILIDSWSVHCAGDGRGGLADGQHKVQEERGLPGHRGAGGARTHAFLLAQIDKLSISGRPRSQCNCIVWSRGIQRRMQGFTSHYSHPQAGGRWPVCVRHEAAFIRECVCHLVQVNMLTSSKGSVLRCDVNGKIVMKVFLSGMPDVKLGLNDKLEVGPPLGAHLPNACMLQILMVLGPQRGQAIGSLSLLSSNSASYCL